MIELTDLQEDILTLSVKNSDMTNREIANILDCSEEYVGEVRRDYEHAVNEREVGRDLQTVSGTADNPPKPRSASGGDRDYGFGIVVTTLAWWLPILGAIQGAEVNAGLWILPVIGWFGIPVLVGLDARQRGNLGSGLLYAGASFFLPMVGGLFYLYRRG